MPLLLGVGVPDPDPPPDPEPPELPDPVPPDGVPLDPDPLEPDAVPEPEEVPDPAGDAVAVGVELALLVDPPQPVRTIASAIENTRRLAASMQRCERMWRMEPSGHERCLLSASMAWVVAAVR